MCDFCESLAADNDRMSNNIFYEFSIAKIKKTWTREKGYRNASQSIDFGYCLKFCPECGRRIKLQERSKLI